jgi:DNA polymerase-1
MLLLIDGNNLAWAGYYALERVMKPEDDERRRRVAMLGLASMILGAIARAGEPPDSKEIADKTVSAVAVCFDEGRPLRRREVWPEYQKGRERDAKFIQNEPLIVGTIDQFCETAARLLPIDVLRAKNTEADDFIAGLVQANPLVQKRIVSTDRDFLQLIDGRTTVYAPVKRLVIGEHNMFDAMGITKDGGKPPFPRERFLDFRALTGDSSDDLPGVPGMGPASAARLLGAAKVEAYFGDAGRVRAALGRKSAALEGAFADGSAQAVVERNRLLMDLRLPAPCWERLDEIAARGRWDQTAFQAWLEQERITRIGEAQIFDRMDVLAAQRE